MVDPSGSLPSCSLEKSIFWERYLLSYTHHQPFQSLFWLSGWNLRGSSRCDCVGRVPFTHDQFALYHYFQWASWKLSRLCPQTGLQWIVTTESGGSILFSLILSLLPDGRRSQQLVTGSHCCDCGLHEIQERENSWKKHWMNQLYHLCSRCLGIIYVNSTCITEWLI